MFYFTCNESKIHESFTFSNNLQEKNVFFLRHSNLLRCTCIPEEHAAFPNMLVSFTFQYQQVLSIPYVNSLSLTQLPVWLGGLHCSLDYFIVLGCYPYQKVVYFKFIKYT